MNIHNVFIVLWFERRAISIPWLLLRMSHGLWLSLFERGSQTFQKISPYNSLNPPLDLTAQTPVS